MRCTGDLEANGFLEDATTIWCGVFKDLDTLEVHSFEPDQLSDMCTFLDSVEFLAIHNGIAYDIPLLESILDYTFKGEVFDTYIVSQMTEPDRVGGHGLAPWGEKFGVPKPKHEDWTQFSPEMLHRCEQDVEINYLVYKQLMRELYD